MGNDHYDRGLKMKKMWAIGFGFIVILIVGIYFLFPQTPMETFLEPYLPQIQAPVLIIWGDTDKILDVGGIAVLERNLKDYKTIIMKNTGHIPMMENPRETASYYVSYLKGKIKLP